MTPLRAASPASAPIGIFDSGLGGMTVLRQFQRLLPHESLLYVADTANVPYGDKPIALVRDLALKLTDHLFDSGVKLIVMASGTSTVAGLDAAQARYPDLPILGTVEAGARTAVAATPGPIGVLATNATVQSRAFTQAVQSLAPERIVIEQGCPRFVPLVESGRAETPDAWEAALEYLTPLAEAGVQAIILGCTHFPVLLPTLTRALQSFADKPRFAPCFVDPAAEAVRDAALLLSEKGLLAPDLSPGHLAFAATGDPDDFRLHASALLGERLPPVLPLTLE